MLSSILNAKLWWEQGDTESARSCAIQSLLMHVSIAQQTLATFINSESPQETVQESASNQWNFRILDALQTVTCHTPSPYSLSDPSISFTNPKKDLLPPASGSQLPGMWGPGLQWIVGRFCPFVRGFGGLVSVVMCKFCACQYHLSLPLYLLLLSYAPPL